MYEDKTLVCKECGKEFVFTAGEQEFYAEKGFQNEPQRCRDCRQARKNANHPQRELYTAVCAACGKEAIEKGAHAGNIIREIAALAGRWDASRPAARLFGTRAVTAPG